MQIEIFASGLCAYPCEDEPEVTVIQGKGWEGQPFKLYLNPEETAALLVQLGFLSS